MKEPTVRGQITEVLPNSLYRVKLENGNEIIADLFYDDIKKFL
jgi:translation initiation factor IF-1